MTLKNEDLLGKLIHIATIFSTHGQWIYVFLRKNKDGHFVWYQQEKDQEIESSVSGPTVEEAMRLAARYWKANAFCTVICGFRYTLPERDEHGINALFHQMAASYSSMNGVYYDEELGNNCFVQNASDQAYRLWQSLKSS
ncbi:MAG: hypothetical protein WCF65_04145 [Parachlamydiaceae bacterium]